MGLFQSLNSFQEIIQFNALCVFAYVCNAMHDMLYIVLSITIAGTADNNSNKQWHLVDAINTNACTNARLTSIANTPSQTSEGTNERMNERTNDTERLEQTKQSNQTGLSNRIDINKKKIVEINKSNFDECSGGNCYK